LAGLSVYRGSIIFAVALIPSVTSKEKPALSTSLPTGVVLLIFALTYVTLSLWFSAASTAATGILWLTMAAQKYRQLRSSRS
jgi:hypothetical protein